MTRFALTLEFDGGPFMGLQRQGHGPSVQESVERAVLEVTGETATLHSAGRTDSGVHALAMVSHVDLATKLTSFRLVEALNARLRPEPIAVLACVAKPDDWHARFSCIGRRYLYRIRNRRPPLTLEKAALGTSPVRSTAWRCTARRRRSSAGTTSPPSAPPNARPNRR